ncbi:MAG TPA: bifunctional UDP-sugar hydrolase/5'-nucleotidase [Cerasibacillus sp.]|uniref:bifunctional metallophosphatase/5'-nucleotidase n=1 Tax=Cerasibacillus sp. TaxID=2498711 RepID=UPI002F3E1FE4
MLEHIHFYYTNDFHSHFSQWSRVANFLKGKKIKHQIDGDSYYLVDIGDHMDRVHPITEASMGKANVELLNDLAYDVVTFGNNEGITLARDDFFDLYEEAQFDVVCANLHSTAGDEPDWLRRYTTVQSVGGVKIGFLGLTVPFNDFYHLLDLHITSPFDALEQYIEKLKSEVDVIILLSHLGITVDRQIAKQFPEIDVIIGGHTHHLFKQGELAHQTLITAAGKNCYYVGELHLVWDHKEQKLYHKDAIATDVSHVPRDLATEEMLNQLELKAQNILGKKVVYLEEPLEVRWFKETEIMKYLTDTVKEWTNADGAMLNAGLLLEDFNPGYITYGDIHRICPHPINPCIVSIYGSELIKVIQKTLKRSFTEMKLKGFGFRGEVLGKMIFSDIEFTPITDEKEGLIITDVAIRGRALKENTTYNIATADSFTFGALLPEISQAKQKTYFLPEFLRNLLLETLVTYYGTNE